MAAKKNNDISESNAAQLDESQIIKPKRSSKKTADSTAVDTSDGNEEKRTARKSKVTTEIESDNAPKAARRKSSKKEAARGENSVNENIGNDEVSSSKRSFRKGTNSEHEPDGLTPEMAVHMPDSHSEHTDTINSPSEISDNAGSEMSENKEVVFNLFDSTTVLKRRKGRKVKVSQTDSDAEEKSSSESLPQVFVPKHLTMTQSYSLKIPGRYDSKSLDWKIARRPGMKLSRIELDSRLLAHSGLIRIPPKDRAPSLRSVQLPDNIVLSEPLNAAHMAEFCSMFFEPGAHENFILVMKQLVLWNLIPNWYGIDMFIMQHPDLAQEREDRSITSEDERIEEPGPDPAVVALFDIFEQPIEKLHLDSEDPNELRFFYCSNHAGRITALFADWARSLEYIDRGVFGGPDNQPLSVCFIERFQQILMMDFEAAESQGVVLPDSYLRSRFYLDDIDLLLLWFMAGHEMDPNFRNAMKVTWDQQTVIYMSAGTLMRFFCLTSFDRADVMMRLSPSSPMATAGLFKIVQGNVPTQPLAFEIIIAEQIVRQFMGIRSLSVASTQYAELLFPHLDASTFIAESHEKSVDIIRNYLERPRLNTQPNLERENLDFIPSMAFLIEGLPGSGRTTLVKILASKFEHPLIVVQSSPLVGIHPTDCEEYLKALFADASLMNAFVCFKDAGPLLTEERMASVFARQLAIHPVVCAFCVELAVKIHPSIDPYITFKTKMDANLKDSAVSFWNQHLNLPFLDTAKIDVRALSQRMALQPFQIQKATKLAYYSSNFNAQNDVILTNTALEKAAAIQVTKNIGNLAFVSDPEIDLSDVIVSDDIMDKIKKIIGSAQNRRRVLYEWGLSRRIRRGTGVIALFDGEPGTGKTHSAEAIAHELGLSLMRINIATMVDKYIGETEKNLTTIFEQARPDMQLLLFDEADSLFTKRTSNVSKSNDRYSNMSVNVLLQLVERYEGVSILTTNLKNAIDPAFERRITYKVYFPMPKKPERERLWQYMCPPDIVTSEPIDYDWLSELEMSGGEIKNAVLTAAFTAATMGVLLNSEILYNAGVAEASAAGRVLRRYEEGEDFNEF